MPVNTAPATTNTTISDLINKVKADLQNRADVSETQSNPEMRPSAWIRDALRELSATPDIPFEELNVTGPLTTIGPGLGVNGSNYAYPVSQFLNSGDDMAYSYDPVIFLTPAQALAAGLTPQTINIGGQGSAVSAYPMDYLTVKAIQTILFVPGGVPFKYTRFGAQFWFGSQPGQPFNVYLPYQLRHPFQPDLISTPVRIAPDWFDVLAYAAAERGAIALRWNDQATFLHNTLYGDPKTFNPSTGQYGRPGLIEAKIAQQEKDRRLSPIQILPGAQRY